VQVVEVDLSAVRFLDSSGISLLLKCRRRADERGVAYRVTGAYGITEQVLEMTGVLAHLSGGTG
jgi:anti-anti-sigma factor